jgi:hypothetical protein
MLSAGCGGGGGGGGGTVTGGGTAPAISGLVARFLSQACTTTLGQDGSVLSLSASYSDPDGDLPAGRVSTTGSFTPSGIVGVQDFPFANGSATITGTTSGTIGAQPCVRFGNDMTFGIAVAAVDGAGNQSNVLAAQLTKPAGAP